MRFFLRRRRQSSSLKYGQGSRSQGLHVRPWLCLDDRDSAAELVLSSGMQRPFSIHHIEKGHPAAVNRSPQAFAFGFRLECRAEWTALFVAVNPIHRTATGISRAKWIVGPRLM